MEIKIDGYEVYEALAVFVKAKYGLDIERCVEPPTLQSGVRKWNVKKGKWGPVEQQRLSIDDDSTVSCFIEPKGETYNA